MPLLRFPALAPDGYMEGVKSEMKVKRASNHGFTLIESMIVVALLCTVVISIPPLHRWIDERGVVHAVELIRADLQLARLMAINRKRNTRITFNINESCQYKRDLDNKTVLLSQFRGGVRFLKTGPDGKKMSKEVGFNKQGMALSVVPSNIYVTNKKRTRLFRIRVMLAGGISIYEWRNNVWH